MPIYNEEYWMEQERRRQWEGLLAGAYRQEQGWFEQMMGQYYEKEQQNIEDRENGGFRMKKKLKKNCWRCGGTEKIMPPIENFICTLNYIDVEPVPCPVCHPEFWEGYPTHKANALKP